VLYGIILGHKYNNERLDPIFRYAKRWLIELDFRSIKTHMKMDMLRCKSSELVQKEIAVFLLAYNLIRASIARAATVMRKIPRQISFMMAVQLLNEGVLLLMQLSGKNLKQVIDGLLKAIASIHLSARRNEGHNLVP
jgi:Transposase DDE domain